MKTGAPAGDLRHPPRAGALAASRLTRNTPGQKDLTRFTFDDASPAGTVVVGFNSDKTGFSGNNTGDGCFLFDTDGDGNANSAVCVTVGGDPAVLLTTRIFLCGDGSVFKCTNPQTEVTTFTTSCSAGQTNTDPFPTGEVIRPTRR